MKKTLQFSLVMLLVLSVVLAGCGKKSSNDGGKERASKGSDIKIGMVTDMGGINDKSFNQSSWEGLKQLEKETGAKVKNLESKTDADYVPNLTQFASEKYALTWGIGQTIDKAMKTVADQNKDAKFAIIDNMVEAPNVHSVVFAENEGSFLAGVVAGLMTKTNKVGFVGGMEIPVIKRFEAGYVAGVKAANPNVEVKVNYTGAFDKPDQGKSAASTLYNDGADIIFHAAGNTGNGVFNEAIDREKQGKKVWVIGVDKDQSLEYGDKVILTSMIKKVDEAVIKISKTVIDGKFEGGKTTVLGLKDNGVGLADTSKKNVPEDVLKKVDEFKDKIIKGEIKVPEQ
ncbi:BMP family ABC transporter substrate-binding protein [Paenibacillus larvae]